MIFKKENQDVSAKQILQAIANGDDIDLFRCRITSSLDLNALVGKEINYDLKGLAIHQEEYKSVIVLDHKLRFYGCTFEDNVFFASPWNEQDFLDVVFKREVVFNSSVFKGQTRFSGAKFHGQAAFDGCIFNGVASFTEIEFRSLALFRTVEFNGYGLFNDSVFRKDARFVNTVFSRGANFTNVVFGGNTDFTGSYCSNRAVPICDGVVFKKYNYGEDETFWRFLKQATRDSGYYRQSGECFYKERCAMYYRKLRGRDYDSLKVKAKIWRWISGIRLLPELVFGKYLFGYGERPMRVLLSAMLVILVCAALYMYNGELTNREGELIPDYKLVDMIYFSTTTFTTLGFGDISPESTSTFTKFVAMFEAMCGASLTSLFVVCLAKRFSRN